MIAQQLSEFPITLEIPVQWAEMDAAGHVNNVIYLKWFEAARVAYVDELEVDVIDNDFGAGFILARQECKYLLPLTYPDTVVCGIRTEEILEDRMVMHCEIFSRRHERLAAVARATMVTFDYRQRRKVPVPAALRQKIRNLEKEKAD